MTARALENRAAARRELQLRHARRDLAAFAGYVFGLQLAPHHQAWSAALSDAPRLVLMAPVEHGKPPWLPSRYHCGPSATRRIRGSHSFRRPTRKLRVRLRRSASTFSATHACVRYFRTCVQHAEPASAGQTPKSLLSDRVRRRIHPSLRSGSTGRCSALASTSPFWMTSVRSRTLLRPVSAKR